MLPSLFARFAQKRPLSVMSRAVLERLLSPGWVDKVFEATAEEQYTRDLLFSSIFSLMTRVVFRRAGSVRQAYVQSDEEIPVSLTSVYNKLHGVEPVTCAALVRQAGESTSELVDAIGGQRPAALEGYPIRIVDGNCLRATEHRLAVLRDVASGPLPGKALVVLDAERRCVREVVPCEDGHAQERSLFDQLLPLVNPGELWIEDRNFCTRDFLFGVVERGAFILVREHANLPLKSAGRATWVGKTPTGGVWEQPVKLHTDDGRELTLRRVTVGLRKATRDGDRQISILTNLPYTIKATKVANLYRDRWTIETAFQELARDLHSEITTQGYPRAALFGFCIALVAFNIMALVHASLRAQHGAEKIDQEFSRDYFARELQSCHDGMMVAIPPQRWGIFASMSDAQFAAVIQDLSSRVNLKRYPKSRRKPKKPKPKRKLDPSKPHVATARLLAARKKK